MTWFIAALFAISVGFNFMQLATYASHVDRIEQLEHELEGRS